MLTVKQMLTFIRSSSTWKLQNRMTSRLENGAVGTPMCMHERTDEWAVQKYNATTAHPLGGSVAEWLVCWTQAQKGPGFKSQSRRCRVTSLRQTVHTYHASVHQAAKLVAAFLRVAGVTAGLAESNGSLPPGLWLTSPAGWLPRTRISSGTLCSVISMGYLYLFTNVFAWCVSHILHVPCRYVDGV